MRQRMSELTEKKLLEKEADWWDREDEGDGRWINEGVRIFQNLSRKNREEIRYKETLAYLLLMQGEDLKMRQRSYEDAITNFKKVIRLDPNNARAYYRLGFLYFYEEAWTRSIDSFQHALKQKARQMRNQLTKEQTIKAHHYILKTTQIIVSETLLQIKNIPQEELDLFGEINLLIEEMKEGYGANGQEKPYQMIKNGKEFYDISEREYELLSDIDENKEVIILNQISLNDTKLSLYGKEVGIPSNQVLLLEYLMRHPEGVRREEIIQRRFRQSRDPESALRQNIRRLRARLEGLVPLHEFIQTIDGGYRWNTLHEYRMFKHSRDVSTDLLLD